MSQKPIEETIIMQMATTGPEQDLGGHARDSAWQAELVTRCIAGDERAFEIITEQYGSLLLRTAFLLVRDEEAAKDLVQDSLLLAWKNMEKLREPAALRGWLLKIVVNQGMSLKRRWARKTALLREQLLQNHLDESIRRTDFQRGRIEEELDLEQAIARLPYKQRAVLVLFYYQRMTMPEIAAMVGVAENTLRKRLQVALAKIRRILETPASQKDTVTERHYIRAPQHTGEVYDG